MPLSNKQSAVLKGMLIGGLIAVSIVLLGGYFNPLQYSDALNLLERLNVAISWSLIPAVFLAIAIGRIQSIDFLRLKTSMLGLIQKELLGHAFSNHYCKTH